MPRRPMVPHPAARWRLPGTWAVVLLLIGAGPGPVQAASHPADGKPVSQATPPGALRFTRSYGWAPLEARRLVLWGGVEEPYLVDLVPGCADLRTARVSAVTTHDRHLIPRTDSLTVDGVACPVERIQPAGGSTLRSLGVGREAARPLPIVPIPPARKTP